MDGGPATQAGGDMKSPAASRDVPRINTMTSPVAPEVYQFGNMNSPMAPEAVSSLNNMNSPLAPEVVSPFSNMSSPLAPETVPSFSNLSSPSTSGATGEFPAGQTWYDDAARPEAWRNHGEESLDKEAFNIMDKEAFNSVDKMASTPSTVGSLKETTIECSAPRRPIRRWLWTLITVIVAMCVFGLGVGIGYVVGIDQNQKATSSK